MPPYRILLADDHVMFREGVKGVIKETPDLELVGEVGDGLELMKFFHNTVPDLVILDITMPHFHGIEAAQIIKRSYPKVKILILTMHKEKALLYQSLRAGVDGYLLKENAFADLVSAINTIRQGKPYISSLISSYVVDFFRQERSDEQEDEEKEILSPRETAVLKLLSQGMTSKVIADYLSISVFTVLNHRAKIKKKLNLKTNAELVKYAMRKGYAASDS